VTLIAVHASADHADILTDTWSYSSSGSLIRNVSKTLVIPHLDMAVASRGATVFGHEWRREASALSADVADFDEYIDLVQARAVSVWATLEGMTSATNAAYGQAHELMPPTLFHVGYSPSRMAFRAVRSSADDGFTPWDVEGLFVIPSPLAVRPSDFELADYVKACAEDPIPADAENLAHLLALPAPRPPETPEGWVGLAIAVRSQRSTLPPVTNLKTLVGGDVHHTHLERGAAVQATVHQFDADDSEELTAVLAGTLHPIGLAAPCLCGSGQPYAACCLLLAYGKPCRCGSGVAVEECCARAVDQR
jgi:uncharacterized protein YchJ